MIHTFFFSDAILKPSLCVYISNVGSLKANNKQTNTQKQQKQSYTCLYSA